MGGKKPRNTYFQDIPAKTEVIVKGEVQEKILKNLQRRFKLKIKREGLVQQQIKTRTEIYNLSLEMKHLEETNDSLMEKGGFL